jgi:hypothetical protein
MEIEQPLLIEQNKLNLILHIINENFYTYYLNHALYLNNDELFTILISNNNKDNLNSYKIYHLNSLKQYIINILELYESINIDIKKNNLTLNHYLCQILNKFIFFIFANNYIINDIYEFYEFHKIHKYNLRSITKKFDDKTLIFKFIKFLKNKYNISIIDSNIKNYIKKINISFNKSILNIKDDNSLVQLYNFKNKFLTNTDLNIIKSFNINNIEDINNYIKTFIYKINTEIYIQPNLEYITIPQYIGNCWFIAMLTCITYSDMSKKLLIKNEENSKISKISDYQYFNNFIYYIINNITKENKKYNLNNMNNECELFINLKKQPLIIHNKFINDFSLNNEEIIKLIFMKIAKLTFIEISLIDGFTYNFFYNITNKDYINNIYKSNVNKYLDIFNKKICLEKYFLINNYNADIKKIIHEDHDTIIISAFIEKIISEFNIHFLYTFLLNINFFNCLVITNPPAKNIDNLLKNVILFIEEEITDKYYNDYYEKQYFTGLYPMHSDILSYFYDLLKISNIYSTRVFNQKNEEIFITNKIIDTEIEPEIIIIRQLKTQISDIIEKTYENHKLNITNKDNNSFIYKENLYKLDYFIHYSSDDISTINLTHAICGIKYNGTDYFYDSSYEVEKIYCNKSKIEDDEQDINEDIDENNYEEINISCPLIKQDWNKYINSDSCYSMSKCGYINIDKEKIHKIDINSMKKLCYDNSYNIVYVYIKVDKDIDEMITGGSSNNKYKSTNKKITLIYNNKQYTRTIYTNNNKKYVLIDKKYISLE